MFNKLARRLIEAAKILLGARPSTVRFDALDICIAEACAHRFADRITGDAFGLMEPLEDLAADDERCCKVADVILEAIACYASFPKSDELDIRRQMEYAIPPRPTDIPF